MAISTEVQGVVDSVDLTASPPLLSIGGQSYTTDKIKRVVRARRAGPTLATRASARSLFPARQSPAHATASPGRRAMDFSVIFKEIRIEALGLGKF